MIPGIVASGTSQPHAYMVGGWTCCIPWVAAFFPPQDAREELCASRRMGVTLCVQSFSCPLLATRAVAAALSYKLQLLFRLE